MILEDKECIELRDLPESMREGTGPAAVGERDTAGAGPIQLGSMTLEELEKAAITEALYRSSYNQVQAARLLGISRDTLRYRMKKFGLLEMRSSPDS